MSVFIALIFLFNSLTPAYAWRPGNRGEQSALESFAAGSLSGGISALTIAMNPIAGALSSIASNVASTVVYYNDYDSQSKPWFDLKLFIFWGPKIKTFTKAEAIGMIAGIVVGAAAGFVDGAITGNSEEIAADAAADTGSTAVVGTTIGSVATAASQSFFNSMLNVLTNIGNWVWKNMIVASYKNAKEILLSPIKTIIKIVKNFSKIMRRSWDLSLSLVKSLAKTPVVIAKNISKIARSIYKTAYKTAEVSLRLAKAFVWNIPTGMLKNAYSMLKATFNTLTSGSFWSRTFNTVGSKAGALFRTLRGAASSVAKNIEQLFTQPLSITLKNIGRWLKELPVNSINRIKTLAKKIGQRIKNVSQATRFTNPYYQYGALGIKGLPAFFVQLAADITSAMYRAAFQDATKEILEKKLGLDESIAEIAATELINKFAAKTINHNILKAFGSAFGWGITAYGGFITGEMQERLKSIEEHGNNGIEVQGIVVSEDSSSPDTSTQAYNIKLKQLVGAGALLKDGTWVRLSDVEDASEIVGIAVATDRGVILIEPNVNIISAVQGYKQAFIQVARLYMSTISMPASLNQPSQDGALSMLVKIGVLKLLSYGSGHRGSLGKIWKKKIAELIGKLASESADSPVPSEEQLAASDESEKTEESREEAVEVASAESGASVQDQESSSEESSSEESASTGRRELVLESISDSFDSSGRYNPQAHLLPFGDHPYGGDGGGSDESDESGEEDDSVVSSFSFEGETFTFDDLKKVGKIYRSGRKTGIFISNAIRNGGGLLSGGEDEESIESDGVIYTKVENREVMIIDLETGEIKHLTGSVGVVLVTLSDGSSYFALVDFVQLKKDIQERNNFTDRGTEILAFLPQPLEEIKPLPPKEEEQEEQPQLPEPVHKREVTVGGSAVTAASEESFDESDEWGEVTLRPEPQTPEEEQEAEDRKGGERFSVDLADVPGAALDVGEAVVKVPFGVVKGVGGLAGSLLGLKKKTPAELAREAAEDEIKIGEQILEEFNDSDSEITISVDNEGTSGRCGGACRLEVDDPYERPYPEYEHTGRCLKRALGRDPQRANQLKAMIKQVVALGNELIGDPKFRIKHVKFTDKFPSHANYYTNTIYLNVDDFLLGSHKIKYDEEGCASGLCSEESAGELTHHEASHFIVDSNVDLQLDEVYGKLLVMMQGIPGFALMPGSRHTAHHYSKTNQEEFAATGLEPIVNSGKGSAFADSVLAWKRRGDPKADVAGNLYVKFSQDIAGLEADERVTALYPPGSFEYKTPDNLDHYVREVLLDKGLAELVRENIYYGFHAAMLHAPDALMASLEKVINDPSLTASDVHTILVGLNAIDKNYNSENSVGLNLSRMYPHMLRLIADMQNAVNQGYPKESVGKVAPLRNASGEELGRIEFSDMDMIKGSHFFQWMIQNIPNMENGINLDIALSLLNSLDPEGGNSREQLRSALAGIEIPAFATRFNLSQLSSSDLQQMDPVEFIAGLIRAQQSMDALSANEDFAAELGGKRIVLKTGEARDLLHSSNDASEPISIGIDLAKDQNQLVAEAIAGAGLILAPNLLFSDEFKQVLSENSFTDISILFNQDGSLVQRGDSQELFRVLIPAYVLHGEDFVNYIESYKGKNPDAYNTLLRAFVLIREQVFKGHTFLENGVDPFAGTKLGDIPAVTEFNLQNWLNGILRQEGSGSSSSDSTNIKTGSLNLESSHQSRELVLASAMDSFSMQDRYNPQAHLLPMEPHPVSASGEESQDPVGSITAGEFAQFGHILRNKILPDLQLREEFLQEVVSALETGNMRMLSLVFNTTANFSDVSEIVHRPMIEHIASMSSSQVERLEFTDQIIQGLQQNNRFSAKLKQVIRDPRFAKSADKLLGVLFKFDPETSGMIAAELGNHYIWNLLDTKERQQQRDSVDRFLKDYGWEIGMWGYDQDFLWEPSLTTGSLDGHSRRWLRVPIKRSFNFKEGGWSEESSHGVTGTTWSIGYRKEGLRLPKDSHGEIPEGYHYYEVDPDPVINHEFFTLNYAKGVASFGVGLGKLSHIFRGGRYDPEIGEIRVNKTVGLLSLGIGFGGPVTYKGTYLGHFGFEAYVDKKFGSTHSSAGTDVGVALEYGLPLSRMIPSIRSSKPKTPLWGPGTMPTQPSSSSSTAEEKKPKETSLNISPELQKPAEQHASTGGSGIQMASASRELVLEGIPDSFDLSGSYKPQTHLLPLEPHGRASGGGLDSRARAVMEKRQRSVQTRRAYEKKRAQIVGVEDTPDLSFVDRSNIFLAKIYDKTGLGNGKAREIRNDAYNKAVEIGDAESAAGIAEELGDQLSGEDLFSRADIRYAQADSVLTNQASVDSISLERVHVKAVQMHEGAGDEALKVGEAALEAFDSAIENKEGLPGGNASYHIKAEEHYVNAQEWIESSSFFDPTVIARFREKQSQSGEGAARIHMAKTLFEHNEPIEALNHLSRITINEENRDWVQQELDEVDVHLESGDMLRKNYLWRSRKLFDFVIGGLKSNSPYVDVLSSSSAPTIDEDNRLRFNYSENDSKDQWIGKTAVIWGDDIIDGGNNLISAFRRDGFNNLFYFYETPNRNEYFYSPKNRFQQLRRQKGILADAALIPSTMQDIVARIYADRSLADRVAFGQHGDRKVDTYFPFLKYGFSQLNPGNYARYYAPIRALVRGEAEIYNCFLASDGVPVADTHYYNRRNSRPYTSMVLEGRFENKRNTWSRQLRNWFAKRTLPGHVLRLPPMLTSLEDSTLRVMDYRNFLNSEIEQIERIRGSTPHYRDLTWVTGNQYPKLRARDTEANFRNFLRKQPQNLELFYRILEISDSRYLTKEVQRIQTQVDRIGDEDDLMQMMNYPTGQKFTELIKGVQKALGVEADGVFVPGGETDAALKKVEAQIR